MSSWSSSSGNAAVGCGMFIDPRFCEKLDVRVQHDAFVESAKKRRRFHVRRFEWMLDGYCTLLLDRLI